MTSERPEGTTPVGGGGAAGPPGGYFLGTECLWPGVVEGISMVTTPVGPRGGGIKGGSSGPKPSGTSVHEERKDASHRLGSTRSSSTAFTGRIGSDPVGDEVQNESARHGGKSR